MMIHLKKNEKLFINGAVIQLDRRGSIELLNDAQFLLASHVMQVETATTPLRRLYFIIQTMIVDPANSGLTRNLYETQSEQLKSAVSHQDYHKVIVHADALVGEAKYFEALKFLRRNFEDCVHSRTDELANGKLNSQERAA
jgi:flagellar biosynthesis repressor protein FlbT